MAVVRELNRQYGITVILITHHMDEAVQAQRVVVMHKGNVLMDGTPREIFTQVDTLRAASLTVPQTIEVLHTLISRMAKPCRSTRFSIGYGYPGAVSQHSGQKCRLALAPINP